MTKISATVVSQHGHFDWAPVWAALGGLGGAATVIVLLITYLPDLFIAVKITSARYQVGDDGTMAITIVVRNRRRNDQALTRLIAGQPPARWRRLWPRQWWKDLKTPKRFDLDVGTQKDGPIPSGTQRTFDSVPLRRMNGATAATSLPSDMRILAYCGSARPYVKKPKKQ
ncbi:MAG: hypothetical protein ACRDOK_23300 [Streptosporangiaceae bacterium]